MDGPGSYGANFAGAFVAFLERRISKQAGLPVTFDIYLESADEYMEARYYMIDHNPERRCIFWLDDYDYAEPRQDIGLHSLAHWSTYIPDYIRHMTTTDGGVEQLMLAHYWLHCYRYPHGLELTEDLVCEISDILMQLLVGKSFRLFVSLI